MPFPVLAETEDESFRWVIEDVIDTGIKPFAIGHRGYGENLGEIADQPIENTTEAVRRAFKEGIQIVEVDTVLTKDNVAVALHDDFLEDYTCVNTLDFNELKKRLEDVSTLRHILQKARTFSQTEESDRPSGQVVVEIKTPSPLCDPNDETIPALVEAVLGDITFTKMEDQVMIESFSPEILAMVWMARPEIPRMLAISILQILPPEVIENETGWSVTPIDKNVGFGLQWGEIDVIFRLPSYYGQNPIGSYITTLMGTGSHSASIDKLILLGDQASAANLVGLLHGIGFGVHVYTVLTPDEWDYFFNINVDGMYVDDIPMGLMLEGY